MRRNRAVFDAHVRDGRGWSLCCRLLGTAILVALTGCRPSARRIAEDLSKSTLFVETFDAEGNALSGGTAFFITPDTALTNMHVMKWAKTLKLSSPARGVSFDVTSVVGVNFDRDLCVLRIAGKEGRPLRFAKKGSVAVGDKVYVAGNPKGLTGTVSSGIVSSIREEGRLVQIDAPISPGSSGGPVVNEQGEVLGVATLSVVAGQNLNFAVETLGGPEVRSVDWPVFDVGRTAVSDLELRFMKGPVKQVREWTGLLPNGASIGEDNVSFDEYGMRTRHETRTGTMQPSTFRFEYHDSRIPSAGGPGYGPLTKRFTYDEGREFRVRGSDIGRQRGTGDSGTLHDAFGRERLSRMPWGNGEIAEQIKEYGENGLEMRSTFSIGGRITERYLYSYEFDALGNWVVKRDQRGDVVDRRTIEYFSDADRGGQR